MPCTFPLGDVSRPVEIAVRVDPEDAAGAVRGGEPAERTERDRVVAAEDERELAGSRASRTTPAMRSHVP